MACREGLAEVGDCQTGDKGSPDQTQGAISGCRPDVGEAVQRDPKLMRMVNGWLTVFWVAMIPVSALLGWLSSVAYVSALSLWALVSGHWAAWQAARVEVTQDNEIRQARKRRNGRKRARTGV
jgi:hypothetical protein